MLVEKIVFAQYESGSSHARLSCEEREKYKDIKCGNLTKFVTPPLRSLHLSLHDMLVM